jgi:prenylcysteine oxidase/farnesylcysteine lyase
VNYGQNLGVIHGLEAMVCLAIEGAMSIEGGNWQIFDNMIKTANATLHLNTTVSGIKKKGGKYQLDISSKNGTGLSGSREQGFDTVVLAAPFQYSDIELEKDLLKRIPDKIPYVHLHVTLFTSIHKLNPLAFNLAPGAEVPDSILTTLPPGEVPSDPENGVGPAGFFSISTLRTLVNPKTIQKEYLYKIFSPREITPDFLSNILAAPS